MAYVSRYGRRPAEYASKSGHSYVVSDPAVQALLGRCKLPTTGNEVDLASFLVVEQKALSSNPIQHVIAVDGGYTEVVVRPQFPSATMAFIQCGALSFSVKDLEGLEKAPFIDPADMNQLKNIERLKLALPIRTIRLEKEKSFTDSVRRTLFEFFLGPVGGSTLGETLAWLIFHEFGNSTTVWTLASCPLCAARDIPLGRANLGTDYTFKCAACSQELFITDVLRLHEAIDEETGAGGILGYLVTTVEQIILVHFIKALLTIKPSVLSDVIFIKDGPLAFFGQTANLHKPMRALVGYLFAKYNLFMAGLEKTGTFVEHAAEIASLLKPGQILILDNDYIYKYIIPGKGDVTSPYGRTTYYGNKVIFKTRSSSMHVVTLPTADALAKPNESDLRNLSLVLDVVERLRCDMYDNALIPVALANKLVSLSNHPSATILERFAKSHVHAS
jgi:hypothetical protein